MRRVPSGLVADRLFTRFDWHISCSKCRCGRSGCTGMKYEPEVYDMRSGDRVTNFDGTYWHSKFGALVRIARYYSNVLIPRIEDELQPCLFDRELREGLLTGKGSQVTANLSGISQGVTVESFGSRTRVPQA